MREKSSRSPIRMPKYCELNAGTANILDEALLLLSDHIRMTGAMARDFNG